MSSPSVYKRKPAVRKKSPNIKSDETKEIDSIINEEAAPNEVKVKVDSEEEVKRREWAINDARKSGIPATRSPVDQLLEAARAVVDPGDVPAIERFVKSKAGDLDPQSQYQVIDMFLNG